MKKIMKAKLSILQKINKVVLECQGGINSLNEINELKSGIVEI
jgi:hypothetical protein